MALIDDIEFYGRAVEAGEMDRPEAVRLLRLASNDGFTDLGAGIILDDWATARAHYERSYADIVESLRALDDGAAT